MPLFHASIRKINFIELKELFYINSRTSIQSKIDYDLKNSSLNNFVLGVEYENPGLKIGAAVINPKGLDWFKVINENKFDELIRILKKNDINDFSDEAIIELFSKSTLGYSGPHCQDSNAAFFKGIDQAGTACFTSP